VEWENLLRAIEWYYVDIVKFHFDFKGTHNYEFALSLRTDFELRLLSNVGTVKILRTLRDGLNAFSVIRQL
jgi:hypothetical protein